MSISAMRAAVVSSCCEACGVPFRGCVRVLICLAGMVLAMSGPITHAQTTYTWSGGGGNTSWSTAGNWSGGVAPPINSGTTLLAFTSGSGAIVNDLSGLLLGGAGAASFVDQNVFTFGAGGGPYVISGSAITTQVGPYSAAKINNNSTATQTFNSDFSVPTATSSLSPRGGNFVFNGVLSGAGAFSPYGGVGSTTFVTLSSTASTVRGFSVTFRYEVSVPQLANAGLASSIGSGTTISLAYGGILKYTGTGHATNRLFSLTGGGVLDASGSGAINFTGSGIHAADGTFTLTGSNTGANTIAGRIDNASGKVGAVAKSGVGTWVLSGSNGYTGGTTLNAGVLQLGNASGLGSTAGALTVNSGTLDLNGNSISIGMLTGSAGGTIRSSSAGSILLTASSGSNSTYAGTIADGAATVGLTKSGVGTLTLSGSNTYSGQTRISAGILALGVGNAISDQSNLLVDGGGFNLAGFNDSLSAVTLTSGSIFGSGTLTGSSYALQGGALNAVLGSGGITVSTGTTTLGSPGRFNAGSSVTIPSGQLTLGGNESVASFVLTGGSLAGTGNTLTSAATYDVRSGGVLAILGGSAGLAKSTAGTVTLAGANTYAGQTTISAGVLALGVNGSFANSTSIRVGDAGSTNAVLDLTAKTSAFSLSAGQTLSGGGTVLVAPSQQFLVQGTFSPGNSPGLFTFDGGTTALSGTTVMEIFGTSRATSPSHGSGFYDAVDIVDNGTLQFGGNLTLEFSSLFYNNSTFNLFAPTTGSFLTSNFTSVTVVGGFYTGLDWNQTGSVWKSSNTTGGQSLEFNATNGTLVIVPEPSTIALAGLGMAGVAWAVRRKCRRHWRVCA